MRKQGVKVEKHHLLQAVTTQVIMPTIIVVLQAVIVLITTLEITTQEMITQTTRITQAITI